MPLFPVALCFFAQAKAFKLEKRSLSGGFCDSRETHRGALSPIFQPRGRGSLQQGLSYQSCRSDVNVACSLLLASLADLNSYNKPFEAAQAMRAFFCLVFSKIVSTFARHRAAKLEVLGSALQSRAQWAFSETLFPGFRSAEGAFDNHCPT